MDDLDAPVFYVTVDEKGTLFDDRTLCCLHLKGRGEKRSAEDHNVLAQKVVDAEQYGRPTPINLRAGEISLHSDMLIHGSAARTNEGHRRTLVFRYLPTIYAHRLGYEPSPELLQRLTPERRKIVQPIVPHRPPRNRPLA